MFTTGFQPGDSIEIEIPDGSIHRLKVVGLVTDQTTSKPDPNSIQQCLCRHEDAGPDGDGQQF